MQLLFRSGLVLGILLCLIHTLPAQAVADRNRIFYEHTHLIPGEKGLPKLPPKSKFGHGVAAIGDIDGDGITELVAGAPGLGTGSLWLLYPEADGSIRKQEKLDLSSLKSLGGPSPAGHFGYAVEAAGDWDGDGTVDVLVGEPDGKIGILPYGRLWLLTLTAEGKVKQAFALSGRSAELKSVLGRENQFGCSVEVLGDWDEDGIPELAIGEIGHPDRSSGKVYICWMTADFTVKKLKVLNPAEHEALTSLQPGHRFGHSIASLGDLAGDGSHTLAIGSPRHAGGGFQLGSCWIIKMDKSAEIQSVTPIMANQSGFTGFIETDDQFGTGLACIGDLSGDSIPDLVVSSGRNDDGGQDKGALYVLYLDRQGQVIDNHKISETSRNFEGQFAPDSYWGYRLNPLGDLNGDGAPDLLVSGAWEDNNGRDAGGLWMLFPADWPSRLLEEGAWATGAGRFSAEDSAMLYAEAKTAKDSARIDSMYDLSGYAPNNLVFLLDISASMQRSDRLPLLQAAMIELLKYMRPEDKISVITYSGKAMLHLDGIPASEQFQIEETFEHLKSQGETKPRPGLQLAYEQVRKHFIPQGNNRIIMATDGGFDLTDLDKTLEKNSSAETPMSVFYFGKMPEWKLKDLADLAYRGKGNPAHILPGSATSFLLKEIKQISLRR